MLLAVVFALLTAVANAISSTLQWDSAAKAPPSQARGLRLATYLLGRREYLTALAMLIVSFLLQATALSFGGLAVVQPLLVTELPFTLLLSAAWLRLGLDRRELLGSGMICLGLAMLLAAGNPHGGRSDIPAGAWLVAGAVVSVVLVTMVVLAVTRGGLGRAVLLGVASGFAFTITAALVKAVTNLVQQGLTGLLTSWQPYAMAGAGALAVLLQQQALRAGTLAAVKPATTIVNPIASVVLGVGLFGEQLRGGLYVVPQVLGFAVLIAGIVELNRSPLVTGHRCEHEPHNRRLAARCDAAPKARRPGALQTGQ